ncbi:MAG: hypothetical protein JW768_13140 [Chitinispirillaceae bacterium]|nr:hypothetical protein [Chitinispirillaceae bacterium]
MKKWIVSIVLLVLALVALYMVIGQKAADEGAKTITTHQGFVDDARKSVDEVNKSASKTDDALKSIDGTK